MAKTKASVTPMPANVPICSEKNTCASSLTAKKATKMAATVDCLSVHLTLTSMSKSALQDGVGHEDDAEEPREPDATGVPLGGGA